MSEEKMDEVQGFDREQFSKFLEKATEEVRGWPAWKQAILGLPQTKSEGTLPNGTDDSSANGRGQE